MRSDVLTLEWHYPRPSVPNSGIELLMVPLTLRTNQMCLQHQHNPTNATDTMRLPVEWWASGHFHAHSAHTTISQTSATTRTTHVAALWNPIDEYCIAAMASTILAKRWNPEMNGIRANTSRTNQKSFRVGTKTQINFTHLLQQPKESSDIGGRGFHAIPWQLHQYVVHGHNDVTRYGDVAVVRFVPVKNVA